MDWPCRAGIPWWMLRWCHMVLTACYHRLTTCVCCSKGRLLDDYDDVMFSSLIYHRYKLIIIYERHERGRTMGGLVHYCVCVGGKSCSHKQAVKLASAISHFPPSVVYSWPSASCSLLAAWTIPSSASLYTCIYISHKKKNEFFHYKQSNTHIYTTQTKTKPEIFLLQWSFWSSQKPKRKKNHI